MTSIMKKTILFLALSTTILFVGCSKDDEGDGNSRTCDIFGLIPATLVDNGNGTATVTVDGESDTFDLEGTDFNTFADEICSGDLELDLGQ